MKILNVIGHSKQSKEEFIKNLCVNLNSRGFCTGAAFFDCNCLIKQDFFEKYNIPVKNYHKDLIGDLDTFNNEFIYLIKWAAANSLTHLVLATSREIKFDKQDNIEYIPIDENTGLETLGLS